jgi:hypothetical protein
MALFNLGRKSVSTTPAQAPKSEMELLLERAAKVGMGYQVMEVAKQEVGSKEYLQLAEAKSTIWKEMHKHQLQTESNITAVRNIMKDASEGGYSPQHLSDRDDSLKEELDALLEEMTAFGL